MSKSADSQSSDALVNVSPDLFDADLLDPDGMMAELTLVELTQAMALIQHQTERISQLEQALDQTLLHLQELRSQLVQQEWLEERLADTEEFANVQQQAIWQLKQQILDKETALSQVFQRDCLDHHLLEASEAWSQQHSIAAISPEGNTTPQFNSDSLIAPLPIDTPSTRLEIRFAQAQQQIQAWYQKLWEDSGDRLRQSRTPELPSLPHSENAHTLQQQVFDLEMELAKQLQTQVFLQQACQELEQDREDSQLRILALEQQNAEMQEQILRQAQQASEYETAVQHWKDRFYQIQHQMLSLKALLEQMSTPLPEAIVELMATLPQPTTSEQIQSLRRALPPRRDLPDFLKNRRGYRAK
ncbi:MAG: hypothetical protein VKJ24_06045 [Synechococcales bacterium]|nr:hypothetical protein [Synechococcales bacterium]